MNNSMNNSMNNNMKVFKFNIFNDKKEIYTKSSISPFLNINPIYIKSDDENEINKILTFVVEFIFSDDFTYKNTSILKFQFIEDGYSYIEEKIINIQFFNIIENINEIKNFFLQRHDFIILELSSGKYWNKVYISLEETESKGCEYTDEEIKLYIKNNFNN